MGIYNTILHDPALAAEMRRAQARTDYRSALADNPKPQKTKPKTTKGKTAMPRRSNQELTELSERKWSDLTPGERKSVRTWMRRQHDDDTALDLEAIDLLEHNQHIGIAKAYTITTTVNSHDDTRADETTQTGQPDEATTEATVRTPAPTPAETTPATENDTETGELQALAGENGIRWLDEWPEDASTAHMAIGHWQGVAAALRRTGRPAVIAEHVPRKRAMGLARTINKGLSGTWSPRGAYRAALRHGEDGEQVIAQYVGGAES